MYYTVKTDGKYYSLAISQTLFSRRALIMKAIMPLYENGSLTMRKSPMQIREIVCLNFLFSPIAKFVALKMAPHNSFPFMLRHLAQTNCLSC